MSCLDQVALWAWPWEITKWGKKIQQESWWPHLIGWALDCVRMKKPAESKQKASTGVGIHAPILSRLLTVGARCFRCLPYFPIVMDCNPDLQSELSHPICRSKGNKLTIVQTTATSWHGWVIQGFPLDWAPMSQIGIALKTHRRPSQDSVYSQPHMEGEDGSWGSEDP